MKFKEAALLRLKAAIVELLLLFFLLPGNKNDGAEFFLSFFFPDPVDPMLRMGDEGREAVALRAGES